MGLCFGPYSRVTICVGVDGVGGMAESHADEAVVKRCVSVESGAASGEEGSSCTYSVYESHYVSEPLYGFTMFEVALFACASGSPGSCECCLVRVSETVVYVPVCWSMGTFTRS